MSRVLTLRAATYVAWQQQLRVVTALTRYHERAWTNSAHNPLWEPAWANDVGSVRSGVLSTVQSACKACVGAISGVTQAQRDQAEAWTENLVNIGGYRDSCLIYSMQAAQANAVTVKQWLQDDLASNADKPWVFLRYVLPVAGDSHGYQKRASDKCFSVADAGGAPTMYDSNSSAFRGPYRTDAA